MATISTTGVVDGQIIYAVHVTRIVNALDGTASNNIIINADLKQGSLTNTTNSTNSHAEGEGTTASGNYSHAEGLNVGSVGDWSHAEGSSTSAQGASSHAEGGNTTALGDYSHAEGGDTIATGDYSHAGGFGTIATLIGQTAVGYYNTDLNNDDVFVVGNSIDPNARTDGFGVSLTRTYISKSLLLPDLSEDATPDFVLAYDDANKQVYFSSASAIAGQATAAPPDKAIQFNSASLFSGSGYFIYDYNLNSFAHGSEVLASGPFSYAQGSGSAAVDTGSHAEGYYTEASGAYSHTEGSASKAYGLGSHAEGSDARARGSFSHAEGAGTFASASWSHAEGVNTEASGTYSHAEGRGTLAIGEGSHTEGRLTIALGDYSHAEGRFTTASGQYSHASGFGTSADDDYQTALGRYNVTGNLADVFVVGVGSAGALANGFGVSTTRTYISNSLFLPDLTNSSKPHVLAYDSASKQVYFAPTSSATASPGEPDKAIQFNSGSTFSGSGNFTFDYITNKVNLTGSLLVTGSVTASKLLISASDVRNVRIIGSGSSAPTFGVYGTQGELFTVTDLSSGSLFSVNDISGLPILDVYSDNTVLLGSYTYPAYHTSDFVTTTGSGAFKLGAIPTSSYDGGYFEYVIKSSSNARSGHITSTWSGTTVVSSSISSSDIGSTSGLTLFVALSSSYAVLSGSAPASGWTVKSIIRAI